MQPPAEEPLCDTLVLLATRNVYDWAFRTWQARGGGRPAAGGQQQAGRGGRTFG